MDVELTLAGVDDVDLDRIREVLGRHDAEPDGAQLRGHPDVEVSYLGPGARGFYAQVLRARLTDELAGLVFDLAAAGPLAVTCTPGPPHVLLCGDALDVRDVTDESVPPWLEVVAVVHSPAELADALSGGWRAYRSTFADRYWGGPDAWPEEA